MRELIARVASHPHGLGFLHLAPLDSIAITLGVDPYVAAQARALLDSHEGRDLLIAEVRKARAQGVERPGPIPHPAPPLQENSEDVEDLIRRAQDHPLGLRFLMRAPVESVAVTLHAHAFQVLAARDLLHETQKSRRRSENDT
jgi:hypothetical protein